MVKWTKWIGERSYRHILNASYQLQMKIAFGIPYNELRMVISYTQACTYLLCLPVPCTVPLYIVDQYMALFYFLLYIAWVTW